MSARGTVDVVALSDRGAGAALRRARCRVLGHRLRRSQLSGRWRCTSCGLALDPGMGEVLDGGRIRTRR